MSRFEEEPRPRVPESDQQTAFISTPEFEEVIPSLASLLVGPEEIDAGSFLFSPGVLPATVFGYALGGEETLDGIEDILRARARNAERGKISKYDAFYAPQTPLPVGVWEYRCETCRFYNERESPGSGGPECDIVGHEEDWFGGTNVHPSGWCALWMPLEDQSWFEYVTERLESDPG
jgi:hypothetical protein